MNFCHVFTARAPPYHKSGRQVLAEKKQSVLLAAHFILLPSTELFLPFIRLSFFSGKISGSLSKNRRPLYSPNAVMIPVLILLLPLLSECQRGVHCAHGNVHCSFSFFPHTVQQCSSEKDTDRVARGVNSLLAMTLFPEKK